MHNEKVDILTLEDFEQIPRGEVFATGVLPNSPDGIFMTSDGGELRWVAKRGFGNDWAIYCGWSSHSPEWVTSHGDKVYTTEYIKRCVPCDSNVLKLYRF